MAHKKYLTKESKNKALSENNKKYFKTKKGKVVSTYINMNRRVRGYVKKHIYEGLEIMSKDDFYKFSLNDDQYNKLHDAWVLSGFDRKLSPSIDRIDGSKGYTIDNVRWITHSENSSQGTKSRFKL